MYGVTCVQLFLSYLDCKKIVINLISSVHQFMAGYPSGGRDLHLNTGLSSSLNWNRRVLTEEADIVTAHGELHA